MTRRLTTRAHRVYYDSDEERRLAGETDAMLRLRCEHYPEVALSMPIGAFNALLGIDPGWPSPGLLAQIRGGMDDALGMFAREIGRERGGQ